MSNASYTPPPIISLSLQQNALEHNSKNMDNPSSWRKKKVNSYTQASSGDRTTPIPVHWQWGIRRKIGFKSFLSLRTLPRVRHFLGIARSRTATIYIYTHTHTHTHTHTIKRDPPTKCCSTVVEHCARIKGHAAIADVARARAPFRCSFQQRRLVGPRLALYYWALYLLSIFRSHPSRARLVVQDFSRKYIYVYMVIPREWCI